MTTIPEAMRMAVAHHQAGRLQEAEQIYRQVLAADPKQPEALHLLGLIAYQIGKHETAIALIQSAINLHEGMPIFHANLGEAYRALRRFPEAIASFTRALELNPNNALANNNLGLAHRDQGELNKAAACFQRAIALEPGFADAHNNLGNIYTDQGRDADAVACYRRALALQPNSAGGHVNLGNALKEQGQFADALDCFERALQLQPNYVGALVSLADALKGLGRLGEAVTYYQRALSLEPGLALAHNNLGLALHDQGKLTDAIAAYRRALALQPGLADAHNNLGIALTDQGNLTEAGACFERALQIKPAFPAAYLNWGNALKDEGRLAEAIAAFRRALDIKPDYTLAHSNLLYDLHFLPDFDAERALQEHRLWNELHAKPLAKNIAPHRNECSAERRLRIGYVSADFSLHPVGRFLLSLLEAHDHRAFEIICYSSLRAPDRFTECFRAQADVWRHMVGKTDDQFADTIRQDGIDILVDLTMHMADNRLLVFARKPAPVQVTYLAYCSTTGLDAMDYRLTDPYLDPPGRNDALYAEKSMWLPDTYWCYKPPFDTPVQNSLPALAAKNVTFGCLNNFCKVSAPALVAWSHILQALPNSRLILHAKAGPHQARVTEFFEQRGVANDRVEFVAKAPMSEYFKIYERIDIALDPFPYGGGTTTCDALWMGVPVVSLAGSAAIARAGLSLLTNVGFPDLVAGDEESYVRLAVDLARDVSRLGKLRAELRGMMQASVLMDAPRFARAVEAAYREMWRNWCAGQVNR